MAEPAPRALLLVLHDVTPGSWQVYQRFIAPLQVLGPLPMTWLVVPDFHGHSPLHGCPPLLRFLQQRLEHGDELALHGYRHCDEQPPPRSLPEWFMRRVYTHEAEFYQLDEQQALERLHAGLEVFRQYDWPVQGFVAPAWLMSQGTRRALSQLPLRYTSSPQHLLRLPDFSRFPAPGLVWSSRSALRRGASCLLSHWRERQWRQAPVIRLGLHPVDLHHEFSRRYWQAVLIRLLEQGREPLTKSAWLACQASSSTAGV